MVRVCGNPSHSLADPPLKALFMPSVPAARRRGDLEVNTLVQLHIIISQTHLPFSILCCVAKDVHVDDSEPHQAGSRNPQDSYAVTSTLHPFWRTKKGIAISVLIALVIIGAVVGGAVGGSLAKSKDSSAGPNK